MSFNVYEVGNVVYFETEPKSPFLIGRIDQFNRTKEGNVTAKIRRFFRRRDLPGDLISAADAHLFGSENGERFFKNLHALNGVQLHQIKHRELFLSDKIESLSATLIRGKCQVNVSIDTDCFLTYLEDEDVYFYSLFFDHVAERLTANRKKVKVGANHQAEIPPLLDCVGSNEVNVCETLTWHPDNNLTDLQIDQFLMVTRSAGVLARAAYQMSEVNAPLLLPTVASASRDVTTFRAMDLLHTSDYNIAAAVSSLIPSGSLSLCKDEFENWSATEAHIFKQALTLHDKDFNSIRENMLPWKTLKNIIEYYYTWKTSNQYTKHVKIQEIRKIFISQEGPLGIFNRAQRVTNGHKDHCGVNGHTVCSSCNDNASNQWFAWGLERRKVCEACWLYWKKYGGLKRPIKFAYNLTPSQRLLCCRFRKCQLEFMSRLRLARHCRSDHRADPKYLMLSRNRWKKQPTFYFRTTPFTRIFRRFCCKLTIPPRKVARCPFKIVNISAVKEESFLYMVGNSQPELQKLLENKSNKRKVIQMPNH